MVVFHILTCLALVAYGKSVPPQVCFEPFNWDDCGRPPVHVLYYYKSGSRCEVGVWRGCLPNPNMFKDQYECVNTCVFVDRPQPEDFHMVGGKKIEQISSETDVTDDHSPASTDEPKPKPDISEYEQVDSVPEKTEQPVELNNGENVEPPAKSNSQEQHAPSAESNNTAAPAAESNNASEPAADLNNGAAEPAADLNNAAAPAENSNNEAAPASQDENKDNPELPGS